MSIRLQSFFFKGGVSSRRPAGTFFLPLCLKSGKLEDAHLLAHPDWANDHAKPVK